MREPDPAHTIESRDAVIAAALLVLAVVLAYANALAGPFFFDDQSAIVRNPTIRQLWPLSEVLSPPVHAAGVAGRPIVNLSLAIDYALGGLDPGGYHVTNMMIHALAALTLFGLVRRTVALPAGRRLTGAAATAATRPGRTPAPSLAVLFAFCIALVWALHPLQTESVTFIIQRTESLAGLFYLLTLYTFVRAAQCHLLNDTFRGGPRAAAADCHLLDDKLVAWRGRGWGVACVAACAAGMATKEIVATAPLVALLHDRTFVAGSFRAAWRRRRGLHIALAATWALLAFLVLHHAKRGGTAGFGLGVSAWDYLLTQSRALVLYLKLSLWPDPLVVDYGTPIVAGLGEVWWQFASIAALVLGTIVALRRHPFLGFAGAWFFLILAPSSSIVPLTTQTIAEHRMYLPLAAVVALLVTGSVRWFGPRMLLGAAAVAVLLGALTSRRNEDYRTALVLWTDTVAKAPANPRAHYNLGNALSAAGRPADALPHYEKALQLDPRYPAAHYNWAGALLQLGRAEEAVEHYRAALRIEPNMADTHANLAAALVRLGRMPEAVAHYEKAARYGMLAAEEQLRFGRALAEVGRIVEALQRLEEAARLNPKDAGTRVILGMVLSAAGRNPEALKQFLDAVVLDASDAGAHCALADAFLEADRPAEALTHYETALRLQPGQGAILHTGMGHALVRLGRAADAIGQYEEALRLNPDDSEARRHLAIVRAAAQRRGLLKN